MTLMALANSRFARFLLVGVLNTAFGYGIYAALLWLGLTPYMAVGIGTVLGVLFNFQSTGRLVFESGHPGRLPRFVLVYAFIYFVNVGCLSLVMSRTGLNAYVAGAVMLLPMAILTFFLQRRFVFSQT